MLFTSPSRTAPALVRSVSYSKAYYYVPPLHAQPVRGDRHCGLVSL